MTQCEAQSHTGSGNAHLSQCPYDAFETVVVGEKELDVCYYHGKVARGEIRDAGVRKGKRGPTPVSWPIGKRVANRLNEAERIDAPMTEPEAEILLQEWG